MNNLSSKRNNQKAITLVTNEPTFLPSTSSLNRFHTTSEEFHSQTPSQGHT